MTATDELRRLLDERGVEWRDDSSIYGTRRTVWTADGVTYVAAEVSGRLKVSGYLTPQQAVEATLGSDLKAENEKLRELVRNLYACINNRDCDYCEYVDEACEFERNMRELGVEVDE